LDDVTEQCGIPFVDDKIEYIRIGRTTYKVVSKYTGDVSFMDLIKNAVKRDIEAILREQD
jgi:hypothetical protein